MMGFTVVELALVVFVTLVSVVLVLLALTTRWGRGSRNGTFEMEARVVVVTGAGSGIGRQFSVELARRFGNCAVHLVDRNLDGLRRTEQEMMKLNAKDKTTRVWLHHCDLTDRDQLNQTIAAIQETCAKNRAYVSVLMNNAGIVHGRPWSELTVEEFEKSFKVGPIAHFTLYKAFLPEMVKQNDGMIVSISSLMGMLPGCKLADYCSSKHGIMGLHDAIQLELNSKPNNRVHMLAVCPYAVDTGMFEGAFQANHLFITRFLFPFLKTEYVVDRILAAMHRQEYIVVMPWILTFSPYIVKMFPVKLMEFCLKLAGACSGMDTFNKKQR